MAASRIEVTLQVNGSEQVVRVEPRRTLLDALRNGALRFNAWKVPLARALVKRALRQLI